MRTVLAWVWPGGVYGPDQVTALAAMCHHYTPGIRFLCIQEGFRREQFGAGVEVMDLPHAAIPVSYMPNPEGPRFPKCYRRLWAFSEEAAAVLGDEVLALDVDAIVASSLGRYFGQPHDFVGWRPRQGWGKKERVSGALWFHRPGTATHVWQQFISAPSKTIYAAKRRGYRGSDQAVMSLLLEGCAMFEEPSGIYNGGDHRHGDRHADWNVPEDAAVIMFNDRVKPWESQAPFVKRLYGPFATAR